MIEPLFEAGDVVWADLDGSKGREQAGSRPAVVVSTAAYHGLSGFALICPVTGSDKPWPFKVPVVADSRPPIVGHVLVDQVRCVDRRERLSRPVGRISTATLDRVLAVLDTMLPARSE